MLQVDLLTLTPFACFGVEEVRIEPLGLLNLLEHLAYGLHALPIQRIARDVAQVGKLQMECAKLGENRAATGCPAIVLGHARLGVDQGVRYARGRLECGQQLIGHMLRLFLVHWIPGECVQCQHPSHKAYIRLEHGQLGADVIQREAALDPVAPLLVLLLQAHYVQRVQAIHNCGAQIVRAKYAARVRTLRQWTQLILAPSIQLVVVPGVLHHLE